MNAGQLQHRSIHRQSSKRHLPGTYRRLMQPNLIRSTANSAMTLLGEQDSGTPEALLLAWVAWERLRIRLLVVALCMQGWQVKDVYDPLPSERFHTHPHYDHLFRTTFGAKPQNACDVGQRWQQLESFRKTRNAYVHGTRGGSPLKLESGVHLLREATLDPSWLSSLSLAAPKGKQPLGDIYRPKSLRRSSGPLRADLQRLLGSTRPSH